MTRADQRAGLDDSDARAIKRASRVVGLQITIASSVLVLVVLAATLYFVFSHIPAARLFDFARRHETTIDIGGRDIVIAGVVIGAVAILLAGTMSWFATRRAVRPLGDALRIQRAFVADASHELRTPLAVLDARLQLLERGLTPDDDSRPIVAELRRDTRTLIDIVNDLLESAEEGGARADGSPVALNPVVELAAESMRIIAQEKAVDIVVVARQEFASTLPAASVHRCIVALLDNALDFAPHGSKVTVSLTAAGSMVRIAVKDAGPGIQGIEPGRIFDRFARSGAAVHGGGSSHTGFGIGLSLVRDTVERVGGMASVGSTSSAGTEIVLLVPLVRPS